MSRSRAWWLVALLGCGPSESPTGTCPEIATTPTRNGCGYCYCDDMGWWMTDLACGFGLSAPENVLCVPSVADVDSDLAGVQVQCAVVAEFDVDGSLVETTMPACERIGDDYTWPAADSDVCWFPRTDPTQESPAIDDLSTACHETREDLAAAEIEVRRRPNTDAEQVRALISCAPPQPVCPGVLYGESCTFTTRPCLLPGALPGCEDDTCATKWCTVGNDIPCEDLPGVTCVPWYGSGTAPAGYEDRGICALADQGPCAGVPGRECALP